MIFPHAIINQIVFILTLPQTNYMSKSFFFSIAILVAALSLSPTAHAQQYKLRQVNSIAGMKSESTIYVKGMRKRTEGGGIMGIGKNLVTIEQCDLQRSIKLNDKKKLYIIEPFAKDAEEIIDEDAKPAATKNKPVPAKPDPKTTPQKGGVINMWYSITDTGERKKIYGFTARHVWTFQKIKPSPDACYMKDSMIIKTDGWYIDLSQFNCPVQYRPNNTMPATQNQPDCKDRYISRRSGKGKLGFPLSETRIIQMGNAGPQKSDFESSLETLELSAEKLDSMLFEIPPGYKEAASAEELQDKMDVKEMINQIGANKDKIEAAINEQKKAGMIRIGVFEPKTDGQLQTPLLQQQMVSSLTVGNIDAVAITSEEEAKKYNCNYTLTTEFLKIKQANKIVRLLKAIKNTDPNAASSYAIEAALTLVNITGGSNPPQQKVDGKYEGKVEIAAQKALDDGCHKVLSVVK
jgi:hypothetical protein